jgi:hypothetical protein
VGVIFFALHRTSTTTQVPANAAIDSQPSQQKPPQAPAAASGTTTPVDTSLHTPTKPAEPSSLVKPVSAKVHDTESKKTPPKKLSDETDKATESTGPCDIPGSQIPRMLELANNLLHAGKNADAERDFRMVQRCERNNAQAEAGLQKIRERRQAQK